MTDMNERPKSGSGEGGLNVGIWVGAAYLECHALGGRAFPLLHRPCGMQESAIGNGFWENGFVSDSLPASVIEPCRYRFVCENADVGM